MQILKLSERKGTEILVNFRNVTFVEPDKKGSKIHTIKESGGAVILVNDSISEIMQKLEMQ